MVLINGERKQHIEITDRGLQYGDGLFETIEVIDACPLFFEQHLTRLQLGCQRLGIPCPPLDLLTLEAKTVCQEQARAVLKIIITRGIGGRGYRQPEQIKPTRVISIHAYPEYPVPYHQQGITAGFCRTQLGINTSLAGVKHLNRLEQILARAEWQDLSIQEGLMSDSNGYVIEGTMSNMFFIKNGIFYTPSISGSGVAGIMRSLIMDLIANNQLTVIVQQVAKAELLAADEIFVCNSIIGIWPVTQLDGSVFPIGTYTLKIQQWLAQLKHRYLNNEQ